MGNDAVPAALFEVVAAAVHVSHLVRDDNGMAALAHKAVAKSVVERIQVSLEISQHIKLLYRVSQVS